ncbi:MAG: 3-isopropylmalate dehydratase small subunit [Gammaproteobacteria bacterium]|jgi:3-isopropylmalate/(R)-2-methylmalate dehydratase small subunit|nr:3-isopropylmalate dehydratase small subunit [SAR86 cluster bacterium]|tara:strand:+ start:437 stop:1081 length:645 start_codon:yes stop_codon:yes gene_type:complete
MAQISNTYSGKIVCLDKANVDTDQIIPKQFLKSIKKTGLGPFLFDSWRYEDEGYLGKEESKRTLKNDFILNNKAFSNANILIAKENFGCGSSREHAVWALKDFGITTVIAPSFGDIFFNNCFKNGILAIQISKSNLEKIFSKQSETKPLEISVDLVNQKIFYEKLFEENFEIDPYRKKCLIEGLDEIGYSLKYEDEINKFEQKLRKERSWVIND